MLISVTDDEHGRYLVESETGSRYTLDLDKRIVRRLPTELSALRLRRDGDHVDLVEVVRCAVGQPMLLLVDLNVPGVWLTTRESTRVVRIDRLPEHSVR
ncbi:hypothetical protein [Glaciibacter psychrotolerans]|uniref:Uncharacterized protein n=1 Tax=Glaciibacter psychrotolerans TaxID=670054 RepID=A0A7Z0EBA7_9MICO|nr:hypothetical protein [Leifsonia psychrotolerans]NYJ18476.1 hypothetical protein [Leifsonia psychrotolerans]